MSVNFSLKFQEIAEKSEKKILGMLLTAPVYKCFPFTCYILLKMFTSCMSGCSEITVCCFYRAPVLGN